MDPAKNPLYRESIRINAYECDFNHKWKPAAFFQRLTEAAGVHAARLGVGFDEMLARDLYWVHSRMKIKFFRFPEAGDEVTIVTWPKTIQQKLFFIRDFEVIDSSGERLAAASSAWLIIDAANRKMIPPQTLDFDLPSFPEKIGLAEPLDRLGSKGGGEEKMRLKAGYSVVDIVGHVNNSRYVDWICDAFPFETFGQKSIDWLQINYDHEIRPGEEVVVLANPINGDENLYSLEGRNLTNESRAFEAVLSWRS